MAARFQCEIGKHTGIPHSAPRTFAEDRIITNVKAIAVRADKSAGAAAQAC